MTPDLQKEVADLLEIWDSRDLEPVECNAMRPRVSRLIAALLRERDAQAKVIEAACDDYEATHGRPRNPKHWCAKARAIKR